MNRSTYRKDLANLCKGLYDNRQRYKINLSFEFLIPEIFLSNRRITLKAAYCGYIYLFNVSSKRKYLRIGRSLHLSLLSQQIVLKYINIETSVEKNEYLL